MADKLKISRSSVGMYEKGEREPSYELLEAIADFFNVDEIENVVFTYNCTTALNMAIKGLAKNNAHFIISDLEHNAVLRPLETLKQKGICDYSIAKVSVDDYQTLKNFKNSPTDFNNKDAVALVKNLFR